MYEMWHMIVAYAAGTAAGIWIFRQWTQERIITATIDTLIADEYVRSYEDKEGLTHLYKWHELEDIMEELSRQYETQEDDDEKDDDTP